MHPSIWRDETDEAQRDFLESAAFAIPARRCCFVVKDHAAKSSRMSLTRTPVIHQAQREIPGPKNKGTGSMMPAPSRLYSN
jgi:hypothetical protein